MNLASERKFSSRRDLDRVRPILAVADNTKKNEGTEPVEYTVGVSEDDSEVFRRYSAYLTALAKLTGEKLPPEGRWSRKSYSEAVLAKEADGIRSRVQAMLDACGDLPDPKDKAAVARYAARAYAWSEQLERKKK